MCKARITGLRHNRRMGPFERGYALASLLLLGGCGGAAPATVPLPQLEQAGGGRMEWRGLLPCADCEGIQVQLQLRRAAGDDEYRMVEVYLTGDGGARFVEGGRWRRDGDLIRIAGEDGDRRTYVLLPDRSLRISDARGRPLPQRERNLLRPLPPRGPQ